MFEQAFKNIDDILRKEAGCTTELDYTAMQMHAPSASTYETYSKVGNPKNRQLSGNSG